MCSRAEKRSFDFSCEAVRTIHVSGTNTVLGMIDSYHTNTTTMVDKINTFYDDTLEKHNKPQ